MFKCWNIRINWGGVGKLPVETLIERNCHLFDKFSQTIGNIKRHYNQNDRLKKIVEIKYLWGLPSN